jgi:hypothetical protein
MTEAIVNSLRVVWCFRATIHVGFFYVHFVAKWTLYRQAVCTTAIKHVSGNTATFDDMFVDNLVLPSEEGTHELLFPYDWRVARLSQPHLHETLYQHHSTFSFSRTSQQLYIGHNLWRTKLS